MDLIHGYYHVDGDIPLRTHDKSEEMRAVITKWVEGYKLHPELFQPTSSADLIGKEEYGFQFLLGNVMVESAIKAANDGHEKIVMTFADQFQISRQHLMDQLKNLLISLHQTHSQIVYKSYLSFLLRQIF